MSDIVNRISIKLLPIMLFALFINSNILAATDNPAQTNSPTPDDRLNVIFILTDDMGYSDIGCFGGEIKTPNLDSLATSGVRFTQMYNTAKCYR